MARTLCFTVAFTCLALSACGSSDDSSGDGAPAGSTGGSSNAGSSSSAGGSSNAGSSSSAGGSSAQAGSVSSQGTGGKATGGTSSTGGATGAGAGSSMAGSTTSSGGAVPGSAPSIAGCKILPDDNPWNEDISGLPLHPDAATFATTMHTSTHLHPDWGTMMDGYGIPFSTGTGATPQPMTWTVDWGNTESDPLACPNGGGMFCYPIPLTAPFEGGPSADPGSDRHLLYIDTAGAPDNCTLYEVYNAQNPGTSGWTADNGAIFPLGTNNLRPDGWTSSDAAGLPVLPGLVRLDEAMAGDIRHAIRFTMDSTFQGYIHPATHAAGDSSSSLPPMGLRMRLQKDFDLTGFSGPTLAIFTAMKKYGIILADNGSNWYMSGESNDGWAPYMDDLVSNFGKVHGSDFEAVDTGPTSMAGLLGLTG